MSQKTLYCIRHGEAVHNINYFIYGSSTFYDPSHVDTPLTHKGFNQCILLRNSWDQLHNVELVVVSPLLRTLQTAQTMFKYTQVPIIALECVREYPMGLQTCNKRSSKSELIKLFPTINMDDLLSEEDTLWNSVKEETIEELDQRILSFHTWLSSREESVIALVNHGAYIGQLKDSEIRLLDDGKKELIHCYPYEVKL